MCSFAQREKVYMYGMFSFRRETVRDRVYREERKDIYNTMIMEQETDGRWQSFLISRVHDKLLLMSDQEKKKKQFSLKAYEYKKALFV
jgi:hypothetical protein